jgi:N-carbamoylputrescine amidase
MSSPTFALIQYSCSNDSDTNQQKAEELIAEAAENGANAVLLPELFNTTYFCREIDQIFFDWAEPIPGPTTEMFSNLAKDLGVVIVLPMFEILNQKK